MSETLRVTIFGLGEAGSLIAADLARSGADVHGFDPAPVATPQGVSRHGDPGEAVAGAAIVLAATAAKDAREAFDQAADMIKKGAIYADVATSPPDLKTEFDEEAGRRGVLFVDVALMAPVPDHGLSTPALASGSGAVHFAETVNGLGARVSVLGDKAGDAAAHKLLRSVIAKGLTSLVIEGLQAAEAYGSREWFWSHLVDLISDADEDLLRRFVTGTPQHVYRRLAEMEAATEFLESLGVTPAMTKATADVLRRIGSEGLQTSIPDSDD